MITEVHPRVGPNYFHRAGRSTKRHNLLHKWAALHQEERESECNRRQNTKRTKKKKRGGRG